MPAIFDEEFVALETKKLETAAKMNDTPRAVREFIGRALDKFQKLEETVDRNYTMMRSEFWSEIRSMRKALVRGELPED